MLKIDIRSMKTGPHELEFDVDPIDLGVEQPSFRDIHVSARLDVDEQQIFVRFRVTAVASLVCDRTLVNFDQPVRGSYRANFVSPGDIEPDNEDDSLFPLTAGQEDIDLTDIVRDTLMLSVPIRKIAPGAEDQDIPTSFGEPTESDIDPRWGPLANLRPDSEESPE